MITFSEIRIQQRLRVLLLAAILSSLMLISCGQEPQKGEPTDTIPQEKVIPSQLAVTITKIHTVTLSPTRVPHVGRQIIVEGTVSDPKAGVCVLVHPLNGDTWWVQNLPSPPGKVDDKNWRWRTTAFCGSEELGLNEDFEIVALAETQRSACQVGKTINMIDFPNDVPRSEIITVRRVRN